MPGQRDGIVAFYPILQSQSRMRELKLESDRALAKGFESSLYQELRRWRALRVVSRRLLGGSVLRLKAFWVDSGERTNDGEILGIFG